MNSYTRVAYVRGSCVVGLQEELWGPEISPQNHFTQECRILVKFGNLYLSLVARSLSLSLSLSLQSKDTLLM